MHQTCLHCGRVFYADQPWKTLCLGCWKAKKSREESPYLQNWKDRRITELQNKVNRLETTIALMQSRPPSAELPQQFVLNLRKIISLCHPDRHGGSGVATEMTAYLNGLRDQYRGSHAN